MACKHESRVISLDLNTPSGVFVKDKQSHMARIHRMAVMSDAAVSIMKFSEKTLVCFGLEGDKDMPAHHRLRHGEKGK